MSTILVTYNAITYNAINSDPTEYEINKSYRIDEQFNSDDIVLWFKSSLSNPGKCSVVYWGPKQYINPGSSNPRKLVEHLKDVPSSRYDYMKAASSVDNTYAAEKVENGSLKYTKLTVVKNPSNFFNKGTVQFQVASPAAHENRKRERLHF